jgi:hypothetical protein
LTLFHTPDCNSHNWCFVNWIMPLSPTRKYFSRTPPPEHNRQK